MIYSNSFIANKEFWIRFFKNGMKAFFLALIIGFAVPSAKAQIVITDPYPVQAGNLTRGAIDTSLLTVQLNFGPSCNGSTATVSVLLPTNIVFVPGSLVRTAGTAGTTIVANSSSITRTPTFTVSNIAAPGDITFTIKRTALCGVTGAGKDTVSVTSACGTTTESDPNDNSYQVFAPSLTLTAPVPVNGANLGFSYTRVTSITNGGNGCLDTVLYYAVLPSTAIKMSAATANTISVTGSAVTQSFTAYAASGDTLFYKIYGTVFGTDTRLCNGELFTVSESDSLISCLANTTYYGAYWGRNGANCQQGLGSAIINLTSNVPSTTAASTISTAVTSCLITPETITETFTNSSTNSATLRYNKFVITNNSSGASNNYVDTASILIFPQGATVGIHPTASTGTGVPGYSVTKAITTTAPNCALNMPASVQDSLAKEILLLPGQTFKVTYNVISSCIGTGCGNGNFTSSSYYVTHYYHLQCDAPTTTLTTKASGALVTGNTVTLSTPAIVAPVEVAAGAQFNYKIPFTFSLGTTGGASVRRYGEAIIVVPPGVNLVSMAEIQDNVPGINGTPETIALTGGYTQFRFRFLASSSIGKNLVLFKLQNLTACGYLPITYQISVSNDSGCTNKIVSTVCGSTTIRFKNACNAGVVCANGGITSVVGYSRRSSVGLPDNNQDGRADAAGAVLDTAGKVDLTRYMVGDTMFSQTGGIIAAKTSAPVAANFLTVYDEWNFATGTWAVAGPAAVTVKRAGVYYTATATPILIGTTNRIIRVSLKGLTFTPTLTTPYIPGDSVGVSANFRLNDTLIRSATQVESRNTASTYTYNADATCKVQNLLYAYNSTTDPTTAIAIGATATNGYACDTVFYNAYLAGWRAVLQTNGGSATANALGCNNLGLDFTSTVSSATTDRGGQGFLAEYRPINIPDSFVLVLPTGWNYNPGTSPNTTIDTTTRRGTYGTVTPSINIAGTITGTPATSVRVAFNYASVLPVISTEGARYKTTFNVYPASCSAITAAYTVTEYCHTVPTFTTVNTAAAQRDTLTATATLKYTTPPALTIQNNTGTVQGVSKAQYWDLQLNTSTYAAPNVWVAFVQGSSSISVDSVKLGTNGTKLTPLTYSAGKWFQVTSSIAAFSNQAIRVFFTYNSCSNDTIQMLSSFDCTAYPTDPTTATCTPVSAQLAVSPNPSSLQLSISRQPGNGSSVSLCGVDSTVLLVNSALAANIVNPTITIVPPTGLTIQNPVNVEYPLGSGTVQHLTATLSGGVYTVDLTQHTGIGSTGVPGTGSTTVTANRQASVRVSYTTSCAFSSGRQINFYGYAYRPCGNGTVAATGNGQNVKTNPVNITGIPTTGGSLSTTIGASATSLSCGTNSTITLQNVPLSAPTQAGDTVIYTLPEGLIYAGNFTKIGNCTACTITTAAGSVARTTDVKVALGSGTAANSNIQYSFDITGNAGGCGSTNIEAVALRTYPGVSCGASTCSANTKVIGTTTSIPITRVKPDLNITDLSVVSGSFSYSTPSNVRIAYQNVGTQATAANQYVTEFYCNGQAAPFYTAPITKAMALNGSAADTVSIIVPVGCSLGSNLVAKVTPYRYSGATQCLCNTYSAMLAIALPSELIRFDAVLEQEGVALTWAVAHDDAFSNYTVERSIDGINYTDVATVTGQGLAAGIATYAVTDKNYPDAPVLYYRLRLNRRVGGFSYSLVQSVRPAHAGGPVRVVPNPANNQVTVAWPGTATGTASIQVFNAIGRKVLDRVVTTNTTGNSIIITDVAQYPAGTYLLLLNDAGNGIMKSVKFEIVH